ncbi:ER lumen protein retaining receptor-domain-containing protein, partial [Vararia minispora EC-137]
LRLTSYVGDIAHLFSIFSVVYGIHSSESCRGISFNTRLLYVLVFCSRYLDIVFVTTGHWISLYNFLMKMSFLISSVYVVVLMHIVSRRTNERGFSEHFHSRYLIAPCVLLAALFNYGWTVPEILWSFSIWLEAVAIIPQLSIIHRTGEASKAIKFSLHALTIYRMLHLLEWGRLYLFKYQQMSHIDPISILSGIMQAVILLVFGWVYGSQLFLEQYVSLPIFFCSLLLTKLIRMRTLSQRE